MKLLGKCLTTTVIGLLRIMLGFYFRRVELFHAERVPSNGPVLFASNHPGSITDAFIIGTSVPRQVHFVATVQLFRFAPLAWLLKQCGIIPINRLKDDPRAMRSVAATFEACFEVLEDGDAAAEQRLVRVERLAVAVVHRRGVDAEELHARRSEHLRGLREQMRECVREDLGIDHPLRAHEVQIGRAHV